LENSNVEHPLRRIRSFTRHRSARYGAGAHPPDRWSGERLHRIEENDMTSMSSSAGAALAPPPVWVRVLLGLVLILAGIVVLADVAMASIISAIFIGVAAIVAGGFEIAHAFWTKGWGGFLWQIFLGILYLAFGFTLVTQPVSGAVALTYVLGLLLVVSGLLRIFLGLRHRSEARWIMLISGVLGIIAGLIILAQWPMSGLWVLGLLIGIDLVAHGIAWLTFAWRPDVRAG
jgi:uncharacterized membrane protein HdeD (DUF308 family)